MHQGNLLTENKQNMDISSFLSQLTLLSKCDNIHLDGILKEFESMTHRKILENHLYSIYYSESEDCWRTYLPDDSKHNNRRPLKRKNKENLEKEIVKFYIEKLNKEDKESITLDSLYKEWLLYRRDYTPVKPKTIQENVAEWNRFFKNTELSQMMVKNIKPITLIKFFRQLTKDRAHTYKRISNARSVLNGIFSFAIEEEIIERNPVSDLNFKQFVYKPVENQCDNVFSQEDTEKLLTFLEPIIDPYSLAIQLSFYLFIRIGETKAIKWEDINYDKRTVYLHEQALTERVLNDDLTFSKRTVAVVNQMKGNTSKGFRQQYLTDQSLLILSKAKELNPHGKYVFEPNGRLMTTDRFNRRLKEYCEQINIPYHSSHKIRFYNASTAYNGQNLTTISKLMGHSQVATTLHYLRNVSGGEDDFLAFQNLGVQGCSNSQE